MAGGGTDLPHYTTAFGGEVIAMAIDLEVTVTLTTTDGEAPSTWCDSRGALQGNSQLDVLAAEVVRQRYPHLEGAWRLSSRSGGRAGAGLGSSGAFLVALAALVESSAGPQQLAQTAFDWEHVRAGRTVGPQDSFASAYGGLSDITIDRAGRVEVESLPLHPASIAWINENLLLFDTGDTRDASNMALSSRTKQGEADRIANLHGIRDLTGPFREAVVGGTVDQFGPLLARHWQLKTGLGAGVSTPRAELLLAECVAAGAHGGKLVGAGGGGYVLVSVPTPSLGAVRAAMERAEAPELAFKISMLGAGHALSTQ